MGIKSTTVKSSAGYISYLKENRLAVAILSVLLLVMTVGIWLRFSQFSLDSRYYYAMSLRYSGVDRQTAYQMVIDYQRKLWGNLYIIRPIDNIMDWGLTAPRVVYPLLSTPFVILFGVKGLEVIPIIFTFLSLGMIHYYLTKRFNIAAASVTVGGLLLSTYVMRWSLGMLTESISIFLGVVSLLFAYKYIESRKAWYLVALGAATLTSAFTRQATLIVAGAFVCAWLGAVILKKKNTGWGVVALVNLIVSVGIQLIQSALAPFSQLDQFLKVTHTNDLFHAILALPKLVAKILFKEIIWYLKNDQVLLVLLAICVVAVFMNLAKTDSHLFIGAIAGTLLYAATNGSNTQFRYALPGLIFFAIVMASYLQEKLPKLLGEKQKA
jgi:hypothetical protein